MHDLQQITKQLMHPIKAAAFFLLIVMILAGCKPVNNPPGPTEIPSATATVAPTNTQTGPTSTLPPLRPVVTATGVALGPTDAPNIAVPTDVPTAGPYCYTVQKGQSLIDLISKAGYTTMDVLEEVRTLNNLGASNAIREGQTICIPHQTATPTPQGYEQTRVKMLTEIPNAGQTNFTIATYTVVDGDNITSVQLKTGATLRQICELNNPDPVNCGGCQIDKPIMQQGCAPRLRVGAEIKIPGPTPTPTITPTLTGSETATPTPPYPAPQIVSPPHNDTVTGIVQLVWLPSAILQPDEHYLLLITDTTAGKTYEFQTDATSFRLPVEMQPTDQAHHLNWQVVVSHTGSDGTYVTVGSPSLIYTFTWQPTK